MMRYRRYLLIFIAGLALCSIGALVTFLEWQDVKFASASDYIDELNLAKCEETLHIDPKKSSIKLCDNDTYVPIQVDPSIPDDEIHVQGYYDKENYSSVSFVVNEDNNIYIQKESDGNYSSPNNELMRIKKYFGLLKNKTVISSYQPLNLTFKMNENNAKKYEMAFEDNDYGYEEDYEDEEDFEDNKDNVRNSTSVVIDGKRINVEVYPDGQVIYRYEDGKTETFRPGESNERKNHGDSDSEQGDKSTASEQGNRPSALGGNNKSA